MERDHVDGVLKQWRQSLPELDAQPLAVVGRILRLAGMLEQRADVAIAPFDLALWGFDVLATLRRQGEPYSLTPTELMSSTMLSSGAMTNRIDRLEQLGLVARTPHEDDRRSLRVTLTAQGLRIINKAIKARFAEAASAVAPLTSQERTTLAALLRKMAQAMESPRALDAE